MMGSEIGHWAGRWQAEVSAELAILARHTRAGRRTAGDYVACLGALEAYLQGVVQLARHLAQMECAAMECDAKGGG